MTVKFIDDNKEEFGVEPICTHSAGGHLHVLRSQEATTVGTCVA